MAWHALLAGAATPPDATWAALAPLPERLDSAVFALAVNPADSQVILAGTPRGSIYRSADGGGTWSPVRKDLGRGVLTLAFNPFRPGQVLAGTRAGGVWRSGDSGLTWAPVSGLERATTRSFAFAKSLVAAGTDRGVFASRDGAWFPLGLDQLSVAAVAVATVNDPARLVAGGDATRGSEALPLFQSVDGGGSWSALGGPPSASSMVAALATGPLAPKQDVRLLLLGTNGGVFASADSGATWQQLSGGGTLPNTDFTQVAFAAGHPERFYVASDGGASDRGGLWSTADSGQHFTSLKPPLPEVTALAVSNEETPILYAATFRPSDHAVLLWAYRDTGQAPHPPVAGPPPGGAAAGGAAAIGQPAPQHEYMVLALLLGPEGPFLLAGALAMVVVLVAIVAHVRRARN